MEGMGWEGDMKEGAAGAGAGAAVGDAFEDTGLPTLPANSPTRCLPTCLVKTET
jgi:DNA mismatch repair protein MutH